MIDQRWRAARRLLAVRLDNLGDVLVTTPAIHAIRTGLPEAHLALLASPVGAQAGHLNPDLDEVLPYEAPWIDPWARLPQNSRREQALISQLRAREYDAAVIFTSFRQSPLPAAYLCYLADIPLRLAASVDAHGSLLTTRHRHPEHMLHEVERGLDLVGAVGFATDEIDLVLRVPDAARWRIQEWRRSPSTSGNVEPIGQWGTTTGPLVVVHPGCSMPARTYAWQQYAEVIDLLVDRLDARVVLTGDTGELELVDRLWRSLKSTTQERVRPCAGALSFPELCALIEVSDLMVTNNTGPMHIAAAVKTPTVALFALTNPPEQWGPWRVASTLLYQDVPCRLCYSRICPYGHECLRLVTPATVADAAAELLDRAAGASGSLELIG
jgi:ADP-heptose:LPS heptosyltransferase